MPANPFFVRVPSPPSTCPLAGPILPPAEGAGPPEDASYPFGSLSFRSDGYVPAFSALVQVHDWRASRQIGRR